MTTAIIVCGGSSSRINTGENKLHFKAHGKHLIEYTVSPFLQSNDIDKIIIVKKEDDKVFDEVFKNQSKISFACSGESRTQSVINGLIAAKGCDKVLIHDGARPYVSQKIISDCLAMLKTADSAVAAVNNVDTLKKGHDGMLYEKVDRDLLRIQTPQGFNYSKLIAAYNECSSTETDDSEVFFKKYGECKYFMSNERNKKITFNEDLDEFSALVDAGLINLPNNDKTAVTAFDALTAGDNSNGRNSHFRVGVGFDAHRFCEDRKLILGGVTVPHNLGLLGHSDADVLAHAVMDAVLSALALPDIGHLFPDTELEFKDANSMQLLSKVVKIMQENGYNLNNLSATIIAQSPKLNIHIPKMIANLSEAFNCQATFVGISATTTEHLGFYDKDGIGCSCYLSLVQK